MPRTIKARYKLRSGTTAEWAANDEVLADAEVGEEVTPSGERLRKIGNGIDKFSDLPYRINLPIDRSVPPDDNQTLVYNASTGLLEWSDGGGIASIETEDSQGIALTGDGTTASKLKATPIISAVTGNKLSVKSDGLFTDAGGIHIDDRVSAYANLPSPPTEGTGATYLVDADGLLYVWDGSAWPESGGGYKAGSLSEAEPAARAIYGDIAVPSRAGVYFEVKSGGETYLVPGFRKINEDQDPYWGNVVSLLHFDTQLGSAVFDDQKSIPWEAKNGAKVSSDSAIFGPGGLKDGTYITTDPQAIPALEAPFTVECFVVRVGDLVGGYDTVFSQDVPLTGLFADLNIRVGNTDSVWGNYRGATGGGSTDFGVKEIPTGVPVHIALSCDESSVLRLFVGGIKSGELAGYTPISSIMGTAWGGTANGYKSGVTNLHIDECRITSGVARYTEDFDPPTQPFPDSQ